ncbi:putative heat shock 70 kDa protein 12A [Rhexocercosporidium sp. MPI-PUGE-AT-0058]|nr:putative heat shock 70 kDa protein 12A [Rhexocercosporidium sp. MPI-PUGE-AT-0058]
MADSNKTFGQVEDDFGKLNMSDSDDQLIIAVDFGTTYSGVAFTFMGAGNQTEPINVEVWPDENRTAPKTPTLILYDKQDKKKFTWGASVDRTNPEVLEGIKLHLDLSQSQPLYIPADSKTKKLLATSGKLPIDVASDYIASLYKHAISRIEEQFFKDYVEMQHKKFVLTVPAVWSDKAKDLTLKAAKNAGIYPITLIKEPEAAALYTLHYLKGKALSLGDAFVVCDAGGGTVDLISYEVIGIGPLELKELVPSTAGSLIVNKRFEEFVKDIVGEETFFVLRKTEAFAKAMREFDQEVKPNFRAVPDKTWHLVAEQVDKVRVKRLTDNHPKGPDIKAIFLVGGFGASQYLKARLQKAHPKIQVIQPPNAWGAIVSNYDEIEDAGQPKKWDQYEGCHRVTKMTWYILKGEDLQRDQKVTFGFYRKLSINYSPQDLIFEDELLENDDEYAPKYPSDKGTKVNVILRSDFSKVPKSEFREGYGPGGQRYVSVSYKLSIENKEANPTFYAEINGLKVGSVTPNYGN